MDLEVIKRGLIFAGVSERYPIRTRKDTEKLLSHHHYCSPELDPNAPW